jgi:para-aminobenzoate synthetase component 1
MSSLFQLKTFPIQSTTQQMFAKVAHLPWAVLLESASPDHIDSRFDIFSAEPIATLQTTGDITTITEGEHSEYSKAAPLQLLKEIQRRHFGPDVIYHGELPFIGGALGLLGYDLGRRIEKIPVHAERDINLPELAVGIYDWAWIVDHQTQLMHFLVCGSEEQMETRWLWWQQQVATRPKPFSLTSSWQSNLSQAAYTERFDAIQRYLRAGDCYQIRSSAARTVVVTGGVSIVVMGCGGILDTIVVTTGSVANVVWWPCSQVLRSRDIRPFRSFVFFSSAHWWRSFFV